MMITRDSFIEIARQHGFALEQAHNVLGMVRTWLHARGHSPTATSFYIYRAERSASAGTASTAGNRLRLVLAFATADSAFSFVQRSKLPGTPRLLRVSLSQLLAVMVHRSDIGTVLIADEPMELLPGTHLPAGLRLERAKVLDKLKGE
jgi:hypothetical protein